MSINAISFGRGIYGGRIAENIHFENLARQARKSSYPIGKGKVERYAWECEHGWHDSAPRTSQKSQSSNTSASETSTSHYRPMLCSDRYTMHDDWWD